MGVVEQHLEGYTRNQPALAGHLAPDAVLQAQIADGPRRPAGDLRRFADADGLAQSNGIRVRKGRGTVSVPVL